MAHDVAEPWGADTGGGAQEAACWMAEDLAEQSTSGATAHRRWQSSRRKKKAADVREGLSAPQPCCPPAPSIGRACHCTHPSSLNQLCIDVNFLRVFCFIGFSCLYYFLPFTYFGFILSFLF